MMERKKAISKHICAVLALAIATACSSHVGQPTGTSAGTAQLAPVAVDLRIRDRAEAPYRPVSSLAVPANHKIGDRIFPYEGIGWENGLVGYRLYLDGRLTSDVFGKQVGEPALGLIDASSKYHEIAPWGMDVLHVGPSLGMGGLGIIRDGQPAQFGNIASIEATIDDPGPERGAFTIRAGGITGSDGSPGSIVSRYAIGRASPLTRVSVNSSGALPLAAGIVANPGTVFWQSSDGGRWRYIATYGLQSENKDSLGLALFYRADQARYGGLANATHFVAFNRADFEYGFLAAWARDASRIATRPAFAALLKRELARLNHPSAKAAK